MKTLSKIAMAAVVFLAVSACSPPGEPPSSRALDIPAAAGSMGPNLATGPDGTTVLSWMEPDGEGHALRFAALEADGWSDPVTISRGDNWFVNWADFPSVVPLSASLWAAHWLQSQPAGGYAYDVMLSISEDGGSSWSAPFIPHDDGTPTEHGFVTLFPDSNAVGVVWLDGRKMINEFDASDVTASGMTLRGATIGADQLPIREALIDDLICDCCQTDVALTADGPVAVYRDRTTDEIRDIYVSRREFGEWQPGVPVSDDDWEIPACPVNGPIIRSRGDDVAVAWFTAANDQPVVKVAWSGDRGQSFGPPVEISTDRPLGHIGATLLPDGDLVVSWQNRVGDGAAELALRRVSASGESGNVMVLPEAADVFSFSVPQVTTIGGDVLVVWTTRVDDQYAIHAERIAANRL